jgi:hypothetical protein
MTDPVPTPTPTPASTPSPSAEPPAELPIGASALRIVVRPLPKVVFFYLTWIVSLVCALWPGEPGPALGLTWVGVFFFNALVISFDFNEERSVIFVLAGIVTALALLYFGVLGSVGGWITSLSPVMNSTFYWMTFVGFTAIFGFVWLNTRLDYWEFRPNEVVHRYGIFPKMKRYSTEDMRWDKDIPDMFERLLLGTGTIVLTTPHERHPVVLNHVMRIGAIDDRIADILGVKAVVHQDARQPSA